MQFHRKTPRPRKAAPTNAAEPAAAADALAGAAEPQAVSGLSQMRPVFRQGLQVAGLAGLGAFFCLAAVGMADHPGSEPIPTGWIYGSLAIAGGFFILALVRLWLLKRHGSENLL